MDVVCCLVSLDMCRARLPLTFPAHSLHDSLVGGASHPVGGCEQFSRGECRRLVVHITHHPLQYI